VSSCSLRAVRGTRYDTSEAPEENRDGLAFDGPARTNEPADASEAPDPGRRPGPRAEEDVELGPGE
jgi:hypothetical protein